VTRRKSETERRQKFVNHDDREEWIAGYLPTRKFSQGSSIPRTKVEWIHIFQRQKYWATAFDGLGYTFLRCTVVFCLPILAVVPQLEVGGGCNVNQHKCSPVMANMPPADASAKFACPRQSPPSARVWSLQLYNLCATRRTAPSLASLL